ncbi:MAG: thioredoxin domain-containing protein [Calditrichaeota bacterium]|nr:thioredoxin domain-containing protein [Calditrichota bacterium]
MKNAKNVKMQNRGNRLQFERSPYLRQHAGNPVDWYPWGEEAFERALREDKPILLSIGYSACHWCHVMAHESFEDEAIAGIMNKFFVNIKVDREEYPDIDHIYQSFVQMTTGQGGWPLTVFLTPDRVPFYGGTYFPSKSRYGTISFPDLLQRIHEVYRDDRDKIRRNAAEIKQVLRNMEQSEHHQNFPDFDMVIHNLLRHLEKSYDSVHGGFSPAPKFPHVSDVNFLLIYYHYTGNKKALEMALHTLKEMARGGIYDQIGGGFHRYSTDHQWLVPHFEKMLYDNALLISLYVDSYRLTGEKFFLQIAEETTGFVLRELYDSKSGFASTLDADSEGVEGKYYVWDYDDIVEHVDKEIREVFIEYFGISRAGNFEGKNILHITRTMKSLQKRGILKVSDLEAKMDKARQKLFSVREKRIRPGLDDKVLADWNGMMISALWAVYDITRDEKYRKVAEHVSQILMNDYMSSGNQLAHFIKSRHNRIRGYIDDYVWFVKALLDGFESVQKIEYLETAVNLSDYVIENFQDYENGGFFLTDRHLENQLVRPRAHFDASTPAGNNVMCLNLLRLSIYTGQVSYQEAAESLLRAAKNDLENRTAALASLVTAVLFFHYSPVEMTVSGKGEDFLKIIRNLYLPNRVTVTVSKEKKSGLINPLLLEGREREKGNAVFICFRGTCSLPLDDASQIVSILREFNLNVGNE